MVIKMEVKVNENIRLDDETRARCAEKREEARRKYFAGILPLLGEEGTAALKRYTDMFDETFYEWLANLWDTEIGGFYFSNSGRDTEGLLPDIESTVQVLRFLAASGMMPGGYADGIPAPMREKLVIFAQGLQAEDGYFYHPQWGKNINVSRRGRDLNWAVSMLREFGKRTLYPTPMDTVRSGSEKCGLPDWLQDPIKWREYLDSLHIHGDSYTAGNTVGSQLNEIEAAGDVYIDILTDWMNENQFPDTGMWEEPAGCNAANGFMKLTGIYFRFKKKIPHVKAGLNTILDTVYNGSPNSHVCSSYNPWCSFQFICTTLTVSGQNEERTALKQLLRESAASLIEATRQKIVIHKREDGGFAYHLPHGAETSQKSVVGLGNRESDVNASAICSTGILREMCGALDLPPVPLYTEEDRDAFLSLIARMEQKPKINSRPDSLDRKVEGAVG